MLNILTLNWNKEKDIDILYKSLVPNLIGIKFNWYIKDNYSTDRSVEVIEKWNDSRVKLYCSNNNSDNFSKGMNFLFNKSNSKNSDIILLLNNDIKFGDITTIKNMLKLLKGDIGVVGTKLIYPNSNILQHAGVIFGPRYGNMPYHFRHKEKDNIYSRKNREFQAVTAALCLLKASDYKKINGLDEKFHWSFEDIDACLRIKYELKKRIIYYGNSKVYHKESDSLKKNPVNKLFLAHNVQRFKNKWFGKYKLDHELYLANPNYNIL